MARSLKVCLAQINVTVGDFERNRRKIVDALRFARDRGAGLVTFPELCLTGYPPEDALFQDGFITDSLKTLRRILPETRGLSAVIGFVDRAGSALYNAAAVAQDGKLRRVYRKVHLPNYGVFDEKRYFRPGERPMFARFGPLRSGITICEDIWVKESEVWRRGHAAGSSLMVNISASPYHAGKQALRRKLIIELARRTGCVVIYQNLVGGQDELVFDGGSMIADRAGVLAEARRFEEDLLLAEVRPGARVPGQRRKATAFPIEEEVYQALVLGTRDYLQKNDFKKAVIGLSGGIDSALVARIAVDALGPGHVTGVTMPSRYTSAATLADARRLARSLGIPCLEFPIQEILEGYHHSFSGKLPMKSPDKTEENLQARIRGNIVMALSNKFGWLVLTTGNKSEMATGYCTLYGDMAGGFAVLKDVPKTLVFRLARWRNARSAEGRIPESILRRPPTAELRFGQLDQDTLPPYPVLDRFLEAYVEKDLSVAAVVRRGFPRALATRLARMVAFNEYKRRQSPPGIKITPKAFGRDRRMPITNRYGAEAPR
ncbi:MAG TPA: NAD+ synthase [Candidatus Eisenbacteria bacterium]|nr:NAD+ synthase [Candidatus Eisenbacteria bacterium]